MSDGQQKNGNYLNFWAMQISVLFPHEYAPRLFQAMISKPLRSVSICTPNEKMEENFSAKPSILGEIRQTTVGLEPASITASTIPTSCQGALKPAIMNRKVRRLLRF